MAEEIRSLREFKGQALTWSQPKKRQRYHELVSGSGVYATLTWQKSTGSLAVCRTSENSYSLKRAGFLHPRVTVRRLDYEDDVAVLRMDWGGGGVIEFNDGRNFRLVRKGFWSPSWEIHDEDNRKLCTLLWADALMRSRREVTVEPEIRKIRDPALILAVAWYTMVLAAEEASSVAVVVAVT